MEPNRRNWRDNHYDAQRNKDSFDRLSEAERRNRQCSLSWLSLCRASRLAAGARRPGKNPRNDGLHTMQPNNNVRYQQLFTTQRDINV
jgi:hypothetical protein